MSYFKPATNNQPYPKVISIQNLLQIIHKEGGKGNARQYLEGKYKDASLNANEKLQLSMLYDIAVMQGVYSNPDQEWKDITAKFQEYDKLNVLSAPAYFKYKSTLPKPANYTYDPANGAPVRRDIEQMKEVIKRLKSGGKQSALSYLEGRRNLGIVPEVTNELNRLVAYVNTLPGKSNNDDADIASMGLLGILNFPSENDIKARSLRWSIFNIYVYLSSEYKDAINSKRYFLADRLEKIYQKYNTEGLKTSLVNPLLGVTSWTELNTMLNQSGKDTLLGHLRNQLERAKKGTLSGDNPTLVNEYTKLLSLAGESKANPPKELIDKVLDKGAEIAKEAIHIGAGSGLWVGRQSFRGLVAINLRGWATDMNEMKKSNPNAYKKLTDKWYWIGGDRKALESAIESGRKKGRLLGADGDWFYPTGVEETAAVASATPVIAVIVPLIASLSSAAAVVIPMLKPEDKKQIDDTEKLIGDQLKSNGYNESGNDMDISGNDVILVGMPIWALVTICGGILVLGTIIYILYKKNKKK